LFVLRVAEPVRELQALRSSLLKILALTAAASGLAVVLMWTGLNARLFRPLRELIDGADRMARGDFTGHLDSPQVPELAALAAALNRMSDRVEEQIEHVRAERNHLQEILSSLEDGLLVTDDQGVVQFLNDGFRLIFEVEGEAENRDLLELTGRSEIVDLVRSAVQGDRASSESQLSVNGGRVVSATAAPVSDGGAVLVVRDVTGRVHLDETRRDFVANVSHEIKTPLTAIRGYAETLKEGALDEPAVAAKFTDRILAQCKRLEALLSDLLPLARMEAAEERPLEFAPIDLQETIENAIEIVRPKAEKRQIELRSELPHQISAFVGDTESLEQLILNLLDNAVKYNRLGGRVRLTVSYAEEVVVLAVEDTGIGIPPESLPRVFERFYRVDKGRARDEGGTGLGLALVKHAAKLHGGHIELDSKLGVGSTFRVHLPVSPPMSKVS
jgi:two-component system phosphate regulon sensor histidine kinase PhoR